MNLICHYTEASTAVKILESGILWANDFKISEDTSEINFLAKQFSKINSGKNGRFFGKFHEFFEEDISLYLACFTTHTRINSKYGNLPMARYYGGHMWAGLVFKKDKMCENMDALGREIGFSLTIHSKVCYPNPYELHKEINSIKEFSAFLYEEILLKTAFKKDERALREQFKDNLLLRIEKVIDCISNGGGISSCEREDKDYLTTLTAIISASAITKHICFKPESEFRFALSCSAKKHQHHIEIPIGPNHIKSIILSPNVEGTSEGNKIKILADERGIGIISSPIPLCRKKNCN